MMDEKQAGCVLDFLEQYSDFLDEMINDEKEKLAALVSNNLERLERAILTAQANSKRLEGYEKKREQVLAQNGCAGFNLTELCDAAPDNLRTRMNILSSRVRDSVNEIKWNNDKSMGVARGNIIQVNPDAVLTTIKHDAHQNPYQRAKNREYDSEAAHLITKI